MPVFFRKGQYIQRRKSGCGIPDIIAGRVEDVGDIHPGIQLRHPIVIVNPIFLGKGQIKLVQILQRHIRVFINLQLKLRKQGRLYDVIHHLVYFHKAE